MSLIDARADSPASSSERIVFLEPLFESATATRWTYIMLLLGVLVTVAEGCDIAAASSAAPLLVKHFGISPKFMGLLLASGVVGMVAASYLLAPIADRIGRRPAVLAGLSMACLGGLLCVLAPSVSWLVTGRILAGAGLGLITPAIFAIIAETLPARLRIMGTMIASCGFVLGAALSALLASFLTDIYGYRSSFLVACGLELLVIGICLVLLPESPFFLVRKAIGTARVKLWLARLGTTFADPQATLAVRRTDATESSVSALFTQGRGTVTLVLWIATFSTQSLVYLTASWMPALLVRSGEDVNAALRFVSLSSFASAFFALGVAWLTTRLNPSHILLFGYVVLTVVALGLFSSNATLDLFHVLLAVQIITTIAMQFCLTGVVNRYYNSAIRATGVGYAMGAGRLGALSAPLAGGYLVQQGSPIETIMGLTAVPAAIAGLSIVYLVANGKLRPEDAPTANR